MKKFEETKLTWREFKDSFDAIVPDDAVLTAVSHPVVRSTEEKISGKDYVMDVFTFSRRREVE